MNKMIKEKVRFEGLGTLKYSASIQSHGVCSLLINPVS